MDDSIGFFNNFANDYVCENCGKHFTEDYRSHNTLITSDKKVDKHPRFCSAECIKAYQHRDLREALSHWRQGEDVSKSLSISKGIRLGELSNFFKKEIKNLLLEEQNHECKIC
jgi:hypothetical protein